MRRVVAAGAASGACLAGLIVTELLDAGKGWGDVLQVILGAGAAVGSASGWWLWRQVQAERRYDAALDAELEAAEASFADEPTDRVVTLRSSARWTGEADPRRSLLRTVGGRSRILAVGGAIALVLLTVTAFGPDIGRADGGHEPETLPATEPGSRDFVLQYRTPGSRIRLPNGCTIIYGDTGIGFEGCPKMLGALLGLTTTDDS